MGGGGGVANLVGGTLDNINNSAAGNVLTAANPIVAAPLVLRKGQNAINAPGKAARAASDALAKQQLDFAGKQKSDLEAKQKEEADRLALERAGTDAKSAKRRQGVLAAGASGRSDTILTGPLGLTSGGPKASKTLLGT